MSSRCPRRGPPPPCAASRWCSPHRSRLGPDGTPVRLDDRPVEQIRERWVVEEGWWTDAPVRRAYAELVLADGGLAVVFEDLIGGGWHRHASASNARRGGRRRR